MLSSTSSYRYRVWLGKRIRVVRSRFISAEAVDRCEIVHRRHLFADPLLVAWTDHFVDYRREVDVTTG
ncbi:hypothetical protein WT01_21810 [Burkholderia cepacia]|uniref:Uncharacterized protein n=1 Tax=Burkholderia cepacia TaxID=292 RepID=A0A124TCF4_BURCE|nr:hypothetical protein WS90_35975 [Burkholderia cepacia]KVK97730.1 hypothetical protein WS93_21530 [Burkholderia cepacia]KVL56333.1 hypothetical protein WT01_21810 [Burkholderia cepacia]